jgi:hypothetical protein
MVKPSIGMMSLLGSIGIPSIGFTKSNLLENGRCGDAEGEPSMSLAKYDWHAELSAKCQ